MSSKLNRRDAIKALAAAGAVIAAAPYVAKVSGAVQTTSSGMNATYIQEETNGPLVIVVRGARMSGFRGEKEFRVEDSELASHLNRTFSGAGVE